MNSDYRSFPVTCVLIGACIVVFVVLEVLGLLQGYALYNAGVLTPVALEQGRWYTLLTSMFMHGGILHLLCNMVSLYYAGSIIEDVFGPVRYLVIYFVAGIAGGLASMAMMVATGRMEAGVVGASGAIFGLFGVYAYLLAREYHAPVVLMHAPSADDVKDVLVLVGANILIGLSPGIAMEAHLGGLAAGLLVGIPLYELLRRTIKREIDAGLQPPSIARTKPQRDDGPLYDFEELQAAQDAAMAAQQAFFDEYDNAKPSERADLEQTTSEASIRKK